VRHVVRAHADAPVAPAQLFPVCEGVYAALERAGHREHSLIFRRHLPRLVLDSWPVSRKDPVKGAIVFRAPQGQHLVGVGHSPTTPLTV